jgi:hypothetical protein
LNTIIIAAIVLIVLIVIWFIFTGRMGTFTEGLGDAEKECDGLCNSMGIYSKGELGEGNTKSSDATCKDTSKMDKIRTLKTGETQWQACCCTKKT